MQEQPWIVLPATAGSWVELRLQAHWLAQPLAAFARSCLEPQADDSHTSLSWDPARRWLLTGAAPNGARAALALDEMTLVRLDGEQPVATFVAGGRTLEQAHAWLREGVEATSWRLPDYDMPAHGIDSGALFSEPSAAPLADLYSDVTALFEPLRKADEGGALRVWPHHFDLATLIELGGERTLGVGFSPGDAVEPAGYLYVTPWPHPADPAPQALTHGRWQRDGWFGGLLPLAELRAAERQRETAERFLEQALPRARELVYSG